MVNLPNWSNSVFDILQMSASLVDLVYPFWSEDFDRRAWRCPAYMKFLLIRMPPVRWNHSLKAYPPCLEFPWSG